MSKINNLLILGSNSRSINIHKYLVSRGYSSSIGKFPKGSQEIIKIGEKEISLQDLKGFDLVILSGVSKIIEKEYLNLPKFGMITCHAGALPEYRGSSPLSWSLLNGDSFIGLSVIKTVPRVDEGDIYCSARFDTKNLINIDDLHKLADEQFPFLMHTAILNIENNIPPIKQISHFTGYYPLRNRADSQIKFDIMSADYIKRLFNSYSPRYGYPFFSYNSKEIEVLSVDIKYNFHGVAGKSYQITKNKILVACKSDAVWISFEPRLELEMFARYSSLLDNKK